MGKFIARQPLLFAVGITVLGGLLEFLAVVTGRVVGLPEPVQILIALLVSVAVPLGVIWRLGWWQDAGFVGTTYHLPALTVPLTLVFLVPAFFGTVAIEPAVTLFVLVIFFLTALSEEALSRGLLLRVFLPRGKWPAVLIPSLLFGVSHLTQLIEGMAASDNFLQIANAIFTGLLYATVRLRVNSIWPLIAIHMLFDVFTAISGVFGPAAVHRLSDIPVTLWTLLWLPSLVTAIYLAGKPSTATIGGREIS